MRISKDRVMIEIPWNRVVARLGSIWKFVNKIIINNRRGWEENRAREEKDFVLWSVIRLSIFGYFEEFLESISFFFFLEYLLRVISYFSSQFIIPTRIYSWIFVCEMIQRIFLIILINSYYYLIILIIIMRIPVNLDTSF